MRGRQWVWATTIPAEMGAVRWIGKEKVILEINDRQKYADVFWFSLFHEIGHVLQKRITSLIVAGLDENSGFETDLMKRLEAEADSFAKNMLIPEKQYRQFVARNDFTKANIIQFADNAGIHPGIVVGRLQKDHLLAYHTRLNALKIKYSVPG